MKVLAIDTTAPTASAAITEDGRLLANVTVNSALSHSVTMLPLADACLHALGWQMKEIDLLACASGPGSFTGVRIGVSTLKGLAFADELPCVGVSALESLSRNLTGWTGLVVPVLNARRGQVYGAIFQSDGVQPPRRLTGDDLLPVTELAEQLAVLDGPIRFTGDGYALAMETVHLPGVQETPEFLRYPNAVCTAALAEEVYAAATPGERAARFTAAQLAPVYMRKPQAEREREERLADMKQKKAGE